LIWLEPGAGAPDIWLRSLFGFDPTRDGYIGWTKEAGRDNMIRQAHPRSATPGRDYLPLHPLWEPN
jgi:hypothetical protein